jgi:hypothetical protein
MNTVLDNFKIAFDRFVPWAGRSMEIWVKGGKDFLKPIKLEGFWFEDVTAAKTLIGSDIVFSCEAVLVVRTQDLPRRPLPGELLFYPKNQAWQIIESIELEGRYQIGLNRHGAPSQ